MTDPEGTRPRTGLAGTLRAWAEGLNQDSVLPLAMTLEAHARVTIRGLLTPARDAFDPVPREHQIELQGSVAGTGPETVAIRTYGGYGAPELASLASVDLRHGSPGALHSDEALYFPTGESLENSGLYQATGTPIPDSLIGQRWVGSSFTNGHLAPQVDPSRMPTDPRPSVYFGFIDPHFGHFITDSLARLWWFREAAEPDRQIVFHGPALSPWMREFLQLAGIRLDAFASHAAPTLLRDIVVPRPAIALETSLWSAFLESTADIATRALAGSEGVTSRSDQPVYLSRHRIHPLRRIVHGESRLIDYLVQRKCLIVSPETLSLAEQIRLFNTHRVFIGPWGSAHHMTMFSRDPATHIHISPQLKRTQFMLDAAKGNTAIYIRSRRLFSALKKAPSTQDDLLWLPETISALKDLGI